MFSDLEMDYINPIDLCNRLNYVILPSTGASITLTHCLVCPTRTRGACFLDTRFSILRPMDSLLMERTITCMEHQQVSRFLRVVKLGLTGSTTCRTIRHKKYSYDATEIFRTLSYHKRESLVKLGFYLVSFFFYLYR